MATSSYTVKAGDSLSTIAQNYGVKISDISGYSSGNANLIRTGENLTIRTGGMNPSLPQNNGMTTSGDITRGTNAPEPTNFVQSKAGSSLSEKVSSVANSTLTGNKLALDNLLKDREDLTAKEIAAKTKEQTALKGNLNALLTNDDAERAFNDSMKKFHIEQNITALKGIQEKIVNAQEALQMGLIYEGDRPARERLIQGRSASLQKQGLATIGALQGSAAVIQGNIDLGMSYAQQVVSAINQDNTRSLSALQTLLNLNNSELVDLKSDEKAQVTERIKGIRDEMDLLETNKDKVLDLMVQYPKAFANGGVTLLDTREQALQKMLPTMAADEKAKFDADMASKNRANSGSGKVDLSGVKSQLLAGKANGMPYADAIIAFGDTLDIDYINQVYGRKTGTSASDIITDAYYNQYIDPNTNSIKTGYNVSIDPKNGRPVVNKAADTSGGFWNTLKKALGSSQVK